MKRRHTILTIAAAILAIVCGSILYLRQHWLRAKPADAPRTTQQSKGPLDLRPALIAKLQSLVKSGSDSLYRLRIDSLGTDIPSGTITLTGVQLVPDSAQMFRLHRLQMLPDEVFKIHVQSLTITGIGPDDLLHRRDIDIRAISCTGPQIDVWQHPQPYNADKRAAAKRQSLYSRIHEGIDRLSIGSIMLQGGTLSAHSDEGTRIFRELGLRLANILIDSAAEADQSRFLFAKEATLQAGAITFPAGAGSAYDMDFSGLRVNAAARELVLQGFSLHPHGGREAFLRKQKTQAEVYDIAAPAITLTGADWWAAVQGKSLVAETLSVNGVSVRVYLDKRLPEGPTTKRDNFPQQLLMQAGIPVSLRRVMLRDARVVYDEYNKQSDKEGRISFDGISGEAENVTNRPEEVARQPIAQFRAGSRFMNVTPMKAAFTFELPKRKKGAFAAELSMGAMSSETANPFSEAMGLVRFSGGQLREAQAHIEGNNDNVHGTLAAAYTGLHIEPLKSKKDDGGDLKKKRITTKIANILLVKNNNPANGGNLRRPGFSHDRTTEPNFFNFMWMGIKEGLLKTVGIPLSVGMKQ